MFRKTTDQIIAGVTQAIEDLHAVADDHHERAQKHDAKADQHANKALSARTERDRARKIAEKFASLVN